MNTYDKMAAGWTENQWMKGSTNPATMCVGGRLAHTLGIGDIVLASHTEEWKHLEAVIREQTGMPYLGVQQWNDQGSRTFPEIVAMVHLASLRWDLDHQPVSVRADVAA